MRYIKQKKENLCYFEFIELFIENILSQIIYNNCSLFFYERTLRL